MLALSHPISEHITLIGTPRNRTIWRLQPMHVDIVLNITCGVKSTFISVKVLANRLHFKCQLWLICHGCLWERLLSLRLEAKKYWNKWIYKCGSSRVIHIWHISVTLISRVSREIFLCSRIGLKAIVAD